MAERAAILLSVKPEWWDLIRAGRKTVELRRVTPRGLVPGMPIVWYVSSPTSAIVGEAKAGFVRPWWSWRLALTQHDWARLTGMPYAQICEYVEGAQSPCAIWLREVREYVEPIALPARLGHPRDPFAEVLIRAPQSFYYLSDDGLAAIRAAGGYDA